MSAVEHDPEVRQCEHAGESASGFDWSFLSPQKKSYICSPARLFGSETASGFDWSFLSPKKRSSTKTRKQDFSDERAHIVAIDKESEFNERNTQVFKFT